MMFSIPPEVEDGTPLFDYIIREPAGRYQQTTGVWPTELTIHPVHHFTNTEIPIPVKVLRPSITPPDGSNDVSGIAHTEAVRFIRVKQDETIDPNVIVYSGSQQ